MTSLFYSSPRARFFDSNGNPLALGSVEYYFAGTTTLKEIYTDNTTTTPAQNPQPLDIEGYVRDGGVWLGEGLYDVVLKDENDVVQWTMPNVAGAASDPTGSIGNTVFLGTIDDLINLDTSLYTAAYVFGYYSNNDGGQGWFIFNDSSSEAADGGAIIAPLGPPAQGRWERVFEDDKLACTQWGACPSAPGSVNANLTAWTNYAEGAGKRSRMWIPEGNYVVTPGSVIISEELTVDADVTFETNGPGAFFITVIGKFNILGDNVLENPAGLGSALYDFTGQLYPTTNGEVLPDWYTTPALCMEWAGLVPIIIREPLLVSLNSQPVVHLRFSGGGSLDVRDDTLLVSKVEIANPLAQVFSHPAGLLQPPISIQGGNTIYSASFGGFQELSQCLLDGCILQVNNNMTVSADTSITDIGAIYSQGGYIQVEDTINVTFPSLMGPQTVRCIETGDATFSDSNYSRSRFVITNQTDFNGFVNSAAKTGLVDAENLNTSFALDLTGEPPVEIKNLYFTGGVTADGEVQFRDCAVGGVHSLATATISLIGCSVASSITAPIIKMRDCTVSENVEIIPTATGTQWNFDIRDCVFFGGYIKPNGNALSFRAFILRNDFQFPGSEDPNTFLYTPIDGTNFVVTGETFDGDPVAYNVRVADNTPAYDSQDLPGPTVGTKLLQTVIEGNRPASQTSADILVSAGTMLTPYLTAGMIYSQCLVTLKVIDGPTDGDSTARVQATTALLSGTAYIINVDVTTTTPANKAGYSYKLDLYPQRNL